MSFLLEIGGRLLPAAHRARWREESLALLLEVDGGRRWRYTADILLKLPLLAWQTHRGAGAAPPRPGAVFAGSGLLLAALLVIGTMVLPTVLGEDNAEGLFLLSPFALAPFITREALRSTSRRGTTTAVVVFGAFGPVVAIGVLAAGRLAPAAIEPVIMVVGYSAIAGPGLWLAASSWRAIGRQDRPLALHVLGLISGGAFSTGVAALLWQILSNGNAPAPVLALMPLSLLAFLATFLFWAVWAGLRVIVVPEERPTPTG